VQPQLPTCSLGDQALGHAANDHLLFLLGVIFFLYAIAAYRYVLSLFCCWNTRSPMLLGVYFNIVSTATSSTAYPSAYSGVSRRLDNLGTYQRWFGVQPQQAATLIFGLFNGFGLSVEDYRIRPAPPDGLVRTWLAFNVAWEMGQLIALAMILIAMSFWRKNPDGLLPSCLHANVA